MQGSRNGEKTSAGNGTNFHAAVHDSDVGVVRISNISRVHKELEDVTLLRKRSEWTKEERIIVKTGIIVVVGTWIIIVADFYLLENFISPAFGLKTGSLSLFAGLRILLTSFYLIGFMPASILGEFAYDCTRRRGFRSRNILILLAFFTIFVSLAVLLLTMFDILFAFAPDILQVPLAAVSVGVPILVLALASKVKKINGFVKKAFE